jgi:hypothetical protein
MRNEDLDKIFREHLKGEAPEFRQEAWDKMSSTLDAYEGSDVDKLFHGGLRNAGWSFREQAWLGAEALIKSMGRALWWKRGLYGGMGVLTIAGTLFLLNPDQDAPSGEDTGNSFPVSEELNVPRSESEQVEFIAEEDAVNEAAELEAAEEVLIADKESTSRAETDPIVEEKAQDENFLASGDTETSDSPDGPGSVSSEEDHISAGLPEDGSAVVIEEDIYSGSEGNTEEGIPAEVLATADADSEGEDPLLTDKADDAGEKASGTDEIEDVEMAEAPLNTSETEGHQEVPDEDVSETAKSEEAAESEDPSGKSEAQLDENTGSLITSDEEMESAAAAPALGWFDQDRRNHYLGLELGAAFMTSYPDDFERNYWMVNPTLGIRYSYLLDPRLTFNTGISYYRRTGMDRKLVYTDTLYDFGVIYKEEIEEVMHIHYLQIPVSFAVQVHPGHYVELGAYAAYGINMKSHSVDTLTHINGTVLSNEWDSNEWNYSYQKWDAGILLAYRYRFHQNWAILLRGQYGFIDQTLGQHFEYQSKDRNSYIMLLLEYRL